MGSNGSGSPMMRGFSAGMNVVGFKNNELQTNYQLCAKDADNIVSLLCKQTQRFLDEIASCWASPEAVKYCADRVTDLNRFISNCATKMTNVMSSFKKSGEEWANRTGQPVTLPSRTAQINNCVIRIKSNARDNVSGLVGADVDILRGFNPNILTLDVSDALNSFLNHARHLGFIGGDQMPILEESINSMLTSFKTTLTTISDHIKSFLSQIADKYSDTAGQISSSFRKLEGYREKWNSYRGGIGDTDQ